MPAAMFFLLDKNIDILMEQENSRLLFIQHYGVLEDKSDADAVLFPHTNDQRIYHGYEDDGQGVQLLKQLSGR